MSQACRMTPRRHFKLCFSLPCALGPCLYYAEEPPPKGLGFGRSASLEALAYHRLLYRYGITNINIAPFLCFIGWVGSPAFSFFHPLSPFVLLCSCVANRELPAGP